MNSPPPFFHHSFFFLALSIPHFFLNFSSFFSFPIKISHAIIFLFYPFYSISFSTFKLCSSSIIWPIFHSFSAAQQQQHLLSFSGWLSGIVRSIVVPSSSTGRSDQESEDPFPSCGLSLFLSFFYCMPRMHAHTHTRKYNQMRQSFSLSFSVCYFTTSIPDRPTYLCTYVCTAKKF